MAIQGPQPAGPTARTFNGQLSSTRPAQPSAEAQARARAAAFPSLPDMSRAAAAISNSTSSTPTQSIAATATTPEQESRQLRHQAVVDRAAHLVKNDSTKLASFRAHISSYKNSSMTAPQLIESFFSLFDASSADIGKLVKELADIFEISAKKEALLQAWNDWRAINEDYPSLPGSSSQAPSLTAKPHGGNRVLRLKSSTAQSSRVANSQNASWGNASASAGGGSAGAAAAASSLFPSLPVTRRGTAAKNTSSTTPWAGAMPPSASSASQSRPTKASAPSRAAAASVNDASAFPALPVAAKPFLPSFTPGFNGQLTHRTAPAANGSDAFVWGSSNGAAAGQAAGSGLEGADGDAVLGGKKKGGRKKQTLIRFG